MKKNKGMSLIDVIMAMTILSLFVGIIGDLFYQTSLNSALIKYNATATYYAVKVAEEIDKMAYEDVTDSLNETLIPTYNLNEQFDINLSVRNYNENDNTKEDILKIVTIQVDYSFLNINETYKLEKLKVKEY